MLKVGIVGLGTVSPVHLKAIEKSGLAEIVSVCDIKPEVQDAFKSFKLYNDLETMLKEEELDVVHVCSPHYLHGPMTKLILKYDVNVFLEKPIAISYEEGLELVEAEKNSKGKVGVCFQNRYNQTTQKLKERIADPKYGDIKSVKGVVTWFRPEEYYKEEPWRGILKKAGGGTIINQSIHTLDLMAYVAGKVESGRGSLSNLLEYDIEVEDTAVANFGFENDAVGLYMATNAYYKNSSVEFQVILENGEFTINDYKLYETLEDGSKELLCEDDKLEGDKTYYGYGHLMCVTAFYNALNNNTDDYIHLEDGLASMLMIDIMKKSTKENRRIKREEITHE